MIKKIVLICKHASLHIDFLSVFEKNLIYDTIRRYSKYGKKVRLSKEQISILFQIAEKLYFNYHKEEKK